MYISLIAAVDDFGALGLEGHLPWANPQDMRFFKEKTIGNVVIMGANTFKSLPAKNRPLPERVNCILSRSSVADCEERDGALWFNNISTMLDYINWQHPTAKVYVIGGASVYKQFLELSLVDEMIITRIFGVFNADVFFPAPPLTNKYKWDRQVSQKCQAWERVIYTKVVL